MDKTLLVCGAETFDDLQSEAQQFGFGIGP
jgi:hypothetical protein